MKKLLFLLLFFAPLTTQAAILDIHPSQNEYVKASQIPITVSIDTQDAAINAIEGIIKYDETQFNVSSINTADSVITFWIEQPTAENGEIKFAGIITGGYNSGNASLFTLKLHSITNKTTSVFLEEGNVMLNDGKATQIKLTSNNATIKVVDGSNPRAKYINQEQEQQRLDKNPPSKFTPEISQNENIFNGEYFVAFATTDKESGISHFEIKEGDGIFKNATSPYRLESQTLLGNITVRAIDNAGNTQDIVIHGKLQYMRYIFFAFLGIIFILVTLKHVKIRKK